MSTLSALTESEKRQQKAELLVSYEEAQQELADLAERASAMRAVLLEVGTALEEAKPKKMTCGVPEVEARLTKIQESRLEKMRNEQKYRDAMNLDSVLLTVDLLQRAKAKVEELWERKLALGLK